MRIAGLLFAVGLAGLVGCAVGPRYHRPEVTIESSFGEMPKTNAAPLQASAATNTPPAITWWHSFNDPELDRLIAQALHDNYSVQIALMRVREARYQRGMVRADLFPSVDADAGYYRGRGSRNVVLPFGGGSSGKAAPKASGASGTDPPGDPPGDPPSAGSSATGTSGVPPTGPLNPLGEGGLPGVTSSLYQIGFDSTWELDVFGGKRRSLEAASADVSAAVEGYRDMTVTLLAEVARDYLELRGAQRRLDVARENLSAQQEILDLTTSRANSGLTTRADVARAAAQVAATSATIPPLESSIRGSIHSLSVLLGKEPTALETDLTNAMSLPPLPPEVPVGLPSELMERRPDIRRAERQIASATARIGAAKADYFPKFALTGGIGLDSSSPGSLFDLESRYFLISPTVTWRVFDAGRIASNVRLQKATRDEAVLQYRATILSALREVEDALVAYATEQTRRGALAKAVADNRDALNLVREQYQQGLVNFIEVLDAEQRLLSTQDLEAQSEQTADTDLVALYKALGGGWQTGR